MTPDEERRALALARFVVGLGAIAADRAMTAKGAAPVALSAVVPEEARLARLAGCDVVLTLRSGRACRVEARRSPAP